jgi:hypothetical protein
VGLDRHRVGVHEHLEDVFALVAGGAGEVVVVALAEGLADGFVVLAGELEAQPVVLDALPPQVADLGVVLGPRGFVAGVGVAFLDAEVEIRARSSRASVRRSVTRCSKRWKMVKGALRLPFRIASSRRVRASAKLSMSAWVKNRRSGSRALR